MHHVHYWLIAWLVLWQVDPLCVIQYESQSFFIQQAITWFSVHHQVRNTLIVCKYAGHSINKVNFAKGFSNWKNCL